MDIFKFLLPNKDTSKNYNTLWLMRLNETEHKKVSPHVWMTDPNASIDQLKAKVCKFKLKKTRQSNLRPGCSFQQDRDKKSMMDSEKCFGKMMVGHEQMFNVPPKKGCESTARE